MATRNQKMITAALIFLMWAAVCNGAIIEGTVEDAANGQPLAGVNLIIKNSSIGASSNEDGSFLMKVQFLGDYYLVASHIGYEDVLREVHLDAGESLQLRLFMHPKAVMSNTVEVMVEHGDKAAIEHDPVLEVQGGELQRDLGMTIAKTVGEHPGIAQRSMGPAPARPVLHGLSGDRLLILEDGQKTGDLSATSGDHAVAIEPMTTERIEVIRGPATLQYGPGVLGGVVDVQRDAIAFHPLSHAKGSIEIQGESVNRGASGGFNLAFPAGKFVLTLDGSLRSAGDVNTPGGELNNTGIHTGNSSVGVSCPKDWGVIGVSGSYYSTEYGIPGGFVGAHPNGVDISMNRRNLEMIGRVRSPLTFMDYLDVKYGFARYYHGEYESSGALGMEFGVLNTSGNLQARLSEHLLFDSGVIGVSGEVRDIATAGLNLTPPSLERQIGWYLYEQKQSGRWRLKGAVRFDLRTVAPEREYYNIVIGAIRQRDFQGLSGSFAGEYAVSRWIDVGAILMRSWRAPTVEELFNGGPHLAAYAYEIGNPDLGAETGNGVELYTKLSSGRISGRFATYVNSFDGYIFPSFTGRLSATRNDLYEFHYAGERALMWGLDANIDFTLANWWNVRGKASYVRGDFTGLNTPMPWIPPLSGGVGVTFQPCWLSFRVDVHGAAAQTRLYKANDPEAIQEEGTAAWARLDLSVQTRRQWLGVLHSIVISAENVTDVMYREHLSRVKSVSPEPGFNLKISHRLLFLWK